MNFPPNSWIFFIIFFVQNSSFLFFFIHSFLFIFTKSFTFFQKKSLDFDNPFQSVSACPSLASSPVVARRDSILKHAGSVKNTDRRVSINQPVVVEYMSEKRQQSGAQQQSSGGGGGNSQQQSSSSINYNPNKSNARPASLILMKNERPTFKLIRSPSFDQDQDDAAAATNTNTTTTNFTENVRNMHTSSSNTLARDDDDVDESIPLVQPSDKESNAKITNSINYT